MYLKDSLTQRIGMDEVRGLVSAVRVSAAMQNELFSLLFDHDDKLAFRAVWVMSHISPPDNGWLIERQNDLIEEVMRCSHNGVRRVLLNVLYLQPLAGLSRMDFLDFCLDRMASKSEQPGVQSLCIKIAYEICRLIPELREEFLSTLDMMEDGHSPAVYAAKRNVLKAIHRLRQP